MYAGGNLHSTARFLIAKTQDSSVCDGSLLRIDKGYPGGATHSGNCSYNYGGSVYVLYIL